MTDSVRGPTLVSTISNIFVSIPKLTSVVAKRKNFDCEPRAYCLDIFIFINENSV